jgi:hypothetical protein
MECLRSVRPVRHFLTFWVTCFVQEPDFFFGIGRVVERRRATSSRPDMFLGGRMYIKKCATFLDTGVRHLPAACT